MNLHLAGEVAVVVGGARGIGLAVAEGFVAEGARAVILDRDAGAPAEARRLAEISGTPCVGKSVDATDLEAIRREADEVWSRFGRCDHVVYAAGVGSGKFGFPFWRIDPGDWERVLQVNLMGAVNVAHAFAPRMAEAKAGTLLFIASVAGQIGSQTDPPYSASKAGLINFAQCAARDLASFGVRVNSICPGMIKTTLNRSVHEAWAARQTSPEAGGDPIPSYDEWAGAKVKALIPLGRWQTPEDVAAMAVFLASRAAGNVTGQTINVDGGYVMHW